MFYKNLEMGVVCDGWKPEAKKFLAINVTLIELNVVRCWRLKAM